mgnify:FL=1
MSVNLQVVPIKTGTVRTVSGMVQDIVNSIKNDEYPKEKMDITQFFNQIGKGDNYAPKSETRVQVRPRDRNTKRIERAVNKMLASGDTSGMKPLTVVYYPDTNTYKLLNGNHTSEMAINLGIDKMDVHIVNFETQLEGKLSNAILLGDLLNTVDIEQEATENDSVKLYLYQLMDENIEAGLEPISNDEKKQIVAMFPQVSEATVGQWISNHETVGNRGKPDKEWTDAELEAQRQNFKDTLDYADYAIPIPRTLASWMDTGTSAIFNNCMSEKTNKALIIFYCSTTGQVNDYINTDIKKRIKDKYANYASTFLTRLEEEDESGELVEVIKPLQIDTIFLRYK